MTGRLNEMVALITGGGRGHGRAAALTMAREGAKVIVADLGTSAFGHGQDSGPALDVANEVAAEGGTALAHSGDITRIEDAQNMVDMAINEWGRLDILVNAAGTVRLCTILDVSQDDWDSQMSVHLRGFFNTTYFAAQHWAQRREYGRLINFTSDAGIYLSNPSILSYATAKAGVIGFTRACANALVGYGVTCNAIGPHGSSPMGDAANPGTHLSSQAAIGTDRDPIHTAPLLVFLASPAANHVSGRVFGSYGGRYTLWSEPIEERSVELNFFREPEELYEVFASELTSGLSLDDLPYPMQPLDALTDDWRNVYGARVPRLTS